MDMSNQSVDRMTKVIDQMSVWSGKAVSWLIIPLAGVLVWEVFIRKIYSPSIWAHDLATQFYGAHFMLAGAFTLYLGKHIRTDFFYEKWSPRTQALVDTVLYILLFLPGMVMFFWLSLDFAAESWGLKERLLTPGRPPGYFYKTVIPVSIGLMVLQGISELVKCIRVIRRKQT
jgi:TRAP-type mannitol/chloroaromatic compound transport system permease small subunit